MARRVTAKDGAEAVAMLDAEKPTRRSGRIPQEKVDASFAESPIGKAMIAKQSAAKAMQPHEVKPKAAPKASKAALVRALLDEGKTVKEIAAALKDNGVTWSYAWDVAAAYERKSGKTFIASHTKDGAA